MILEVTEITVQQTLVVLEVVETQLLETQELLGQQEQQVLVVLEGKAAELL